MHPHGAHGAGSQTKSNRIDWRAHGLFYRPCFQAYLGGWLTFIFSLGWIALYTAICGDLATGIGCTVGLKDTVTAITFVALGTCNGTVA